MSSSIMGSLPHDIIRKIILESTREERSRKDALDYWSGLPGWGDVAGELSRWAEAQDDETVRWDKREVHLEMNFVNRLERNACYRSALPQPGSPQADEGMGIMWRRVWWTAQSRRTACGARAKRRTTSRGWSEAGRPHLPGSTMLPDVVWDEWDSLLKDRRRRGSAAIHYDPTGEFILAQHD
jgi:hypothetical protein